MKSDLMLVSLVTCHCLDLHSAMLIPMFGLLYMICNEFAVLNSGSLINKMN